ncbi:GNAT family N-acetyltransferase [Crenobacter sp. SG2305]|uniref:GNAT family N-acetyltransferase n=1 Tax=Crenobacter oryzisoli TaxID=3056844 RepID=UPI0025AAFF55|nr:GNAT family N-acetyltransferase [Crenobacter sp. SG2305]MDN0082973.1 GNAT family N-acetyltransferase [Crenobacter sp. SG2305]
MPKLAFVPAQAEHAAIVADLHTTSWQSAYRGLLPDRYLDKEAAAERLQHWKSRLVDGKDGPFEVLIAVLDDKPVGFVCLQPEADPAFGVYLDNLHVMPSVQGVGLGKQLLAWAAQRAREGWPNKPLFLYVLEDNAEARAFYRSVGGIESAPFPDAMPGGVTLATRRVSWPDVPALVARLKR